MKSVISVVFVASTLALACQKSPDKQAEELRETERQAAERTVEARQEADVKAARAYEEVQRTAAEQGEKVADKAQDVSDSLATARNDLRKDLEEELATIEKRMADLRKDIATSKKNPNMDVEASMRSLRDQTDAVRRDMSQIQTTSADAFGSLKSNLESRVTNLKKSVDDLDDKI